MPSLLAIDAGTTGVTTVLYDADLRPLARSYREFPQFFPQPGQVEHVAEDILAAVDVTVAEVLAQGAAPVAIGITNQRETIFAMDRGSGAGPARALGPGIVWQDRRTSERCGELRAAGHEERVRARTGLLLDPYFSGTKIEWMLQQRPAVRDAQERGRLCFMTVDALIVQHLTHGEHCATDMTNAARTLLFDIDQREWSPELCELFGVDPACLPSVLPSTANFGEARLPGGLRVPIRGIAGDQQAALYGQGCWESGGLKNTYGTGCFLLLNTGEERRDSKGGLLTTLAVARDGSPCYALEGSVFAAGSVIQWLRDQLGLIATAAESEALAASITDTGGVYLIPAFAGLGAPHWDPDARAALLGLTRGTGKAQIVRAGLEAIAYQCAEVIEVLRSDTGLVVDSLLVDGGASANDFLMQFQAEIAGLQVVRPDDIESTARGAAALAGVGAGLWPDPSHAAAFAEGFTRFEPHADERERKSRLAQWRNAVERIKTRS